MENDLVVTEIICIFALRIKTLSVMSKKHESNPTSQHIYVKESLYRAFENMRKAEACGKKSRHLMLFLKNSNVFSETK